MPCSIYNRCKQPKFTLAKSPFVQTAPVDWTEYSKGRQSSMPISVQSFTVRATQQINLSLFQLPHLLKRGKTYTVGVLWHLERNVHISIHESPQASLSVSALLMCRTGEFCVGGSEWREAVWVFCGIFALVDEAKQAQWGKGPIPKIPAGFGEPQWWAMRGGQVYMRQQFCPQGAVGNFWT